MADTKTVLIRDLTEALSTEDTDVLVVENNTTTRKITFLNIVSSIAKKLLQTTSFIDSLTDTFEKLNIGFVRYFNQSALVSSFVEDTEKEGYPYKGVIVNYGITEDDYCELHNPSVDTLYEKCDSFNGGVYIWVSEMPTFDIAFESVTAERQKR